jgi:Ca2+-transporting ATPase
LSLLVAGAKAGIYREDILKTAPEVREEAFDPALNLMATFHGKRSLSGCGEGCSESVLDVSASVVVFW